MSEYRQIHRSFWESGSVEKLDPVEKLLYLYAISGPKSTMEGLYKVTLRRAGFETGIERDMLVEVYRRLEEGGLAGWREEWCCVTQATDHMSSAPQMLKHAKTLYAGTPPAILQWALDMGYKPPRGITCDTILHKTRLDIQDETHAHTISDVLAAVDLAPSEGAGHGKIKP